MPELDNAAIAAILDVMGDLLEVSGADKFRFLSYHKAAQAIRTWPEPLSLLAAEGRLTDVPGIGKRLEGSVGEILDTGTFAEYESLKATFTPTLVQLMDIPGLGPKRARLLHDTLGVKSIADLEGVIADGSIATVPGFGERSVDTIAANIEHAKRHSEQMLLSDARSLADRLLAEVRALPGVAHAEVAGSIRRWEETVRDVDIVASAEKPGEVREAVGVLPMVARVLGIEESKTSVLTTSGRHADIRVVEPAEYGAALRHFTGSEEHNVAVREAAKRRGLKTDEHGVFRIEGGDRLAGETEEEVYGALGMATPPPEIREGRGEVERALAGDLPPLVTLADVRGDFHVHTTSTDAKSTLEENRAVAAELGYEYVAVTDHAYDLRMVRGLDVAQLEEQWAHVDAVNATPGPVVLKGIELNIGPEGGVDYPAEVLARFDFCIASIHGGMREGRDTVTRRMLAVMENPYVDIIGHCTGRILGRRDPMDLDMDAVLRKAGETGTIMEINSFPDRLDLSAEHVRMARAHGVRFALGTDAHRCEQMGYMRYGVAVARRGWAAPAEVLNTFPLAEVRRLLKRARA